jgi:hypothetical protein
MLGSRRVTLGSPTGAVIDRDTTVKTYLGITGTSEDTLLDLYISSAVAEAERYCDRFFLQRTVVEQLFEENASRTIVLMHKPLASLTSIVDESGQTVSSSDYLVDLPGGIVTMKYPGVTLSGDLTVSYVAGWLAASIPSGIALGCLDLIKQMRNAKSRNDDAVIRQSPDIGSVTYKGAVPGVSATGPGGLPDMPASVQRHLAPYRRRWV